MTVTLACTEGVWDAMRAALAADAETAGVLLCGRASSDEDLTLLANELLLAPEDSYLERHRDGLVLASTAYMAALKRASTEGRVALFFHTHPGGAPRPSRRDGVVDEQLRQVFTLRTGGYGTIIAGGRPEQPTFTGQWWVGDSDTVAIGQLRVAGNRLRVQSAWDNDPGEDDPPERYDRQVRAFGVAGQRLLRRLRVGVVGAGGTGSAVVEQLVRLGVGSLTLVDHDRVTPTNLTRIYGSCDADVGVAKVDVLKHHAEGIGTGVDVRAIVASVNDIEAMQALRHCDVVFGCTDDHRGRAVLSRLAYWYLLPVIDMGFVITSADGRTSGLFGRVTVATPGAPCLMCRGRIDAARMREEALTPEERARRVAEGYAQGLHDPDPAVITYTTMVASLAVNELLARLLGFGPEPMPTELLVRAHERTINRLGGTAQPDHYCVDPAVIGAGDTSPALGLLWV